MTTLTRQDLNFGQGNVLCYAANWYACKASCWRMSLWNCCWRVALSLNFLQLRGSGWNLCREEHLKKKKILWVYGIALHASPCPRFSIFYFCVSVVADVLSEFLEVAVHLILYVREVYPIGIFQKRKKYNVPVQVGDFPGSWQPCGQAK